MSNLKTFTEIFKEVEKAKSKKEKIAILHANSGVFLKEILGYTFNPKIKWIVPEGCPEFQNPPEDPNVLRQRLYQELKRLQYFTNLSPYPNMEKRKLESMFLDMMKTIHPDDAKLIIHIKDKRELPFKGVTKALIEEAFPKLAEKWK